MSAPSVAQVRAVLDEVVDPELPVLTIGALGVLRDVQVDDAGVHVTITPTYSGCPAMAEIHADIRSALAAAGIDDVDVRTVLSPAWTTDWMSQAGRDALQSYGIAPPAGRGAAGAVPVSIGRRPQLSCPQCGSGDTEELARFASTSCKSMWRCRDCREPFDHFKDH